MLPRVKASLTPHPCHKATASSAVWALADGAGDAEEGRGQGTARGREGTRAAGRGQGPEARPAAAGQLGQWGFMCPSLGGGPGRVHPGGCGSQKGAHTPPQPCLHRWEGWAGPSLHWTEKETWPQTTIGSTRVTPQVPGRSRTRTQGSMDPSQSSLRGPVAVVAWSGTS